MSNWNQIKKEIKGCTLVFFRAGADTVDQVTGRKAHAVLAQEIKWNDPCTVTVSVIGKTAWVDEPSWTKYHAESC